MKYDLLIPEVVYLEVAEAGEYYRKIQERLDQKFYLNFENTLVLLQQNPFNFQVQRNDFRQALLTGFPYLLIYKIYGDQILIFKLIHAKKHPAKRYK